MLAVILNAVVRRIRSAGAALEQNPGERDTVATYLGHSIPCRRNRACKDCSEELEEMQGGTRGGGRMMRCDPSPSKSQEKKPHSFPQT